MILILSKSISEISTNNIIEYLETKKVKYYRFNGDDFVNGKVKLSFFINENDEWDFNISDVELKINFQKKDVNVVWFRRHFNNEKNEYDENIESNTYLSKEIRKIYSLFQITLRDVKWINTPSDIDNKFKMLQTALDVGLKIPETVITNNILGFERFKNISDSFITKSAGNVTGFKDKEQQLVISTHRINIEEINEEFFFPSLIQKEIIKDYEVRSFYLERHFYSIAIFSQKNKKTELDFRNYDKINPNRMSRYTLPKEIETKCKLLMQKLNLNCGSIDFIKGIDGNYYFLEVNTVGQFGFTSRFGNYNLEKKIAYNLIKENEKKTTHI